MNPLIMPASTAITFALVFYTIGVFGERRAGTLKKSHLVLFWLGLIIGIVLFAQERKRAC